MATTGNYPLVVFFAAVLFSGYTIQDCYLLVVSSIFKSASNGLFVNGYTICFR